MILHAGLVALERRGVLITGPSGVGKSDLALRAIGEGFSLVSDDRTIVWASGGKVFGRAPDAIFGLIEARGFGPVRMCALRLARIVLVVRCVEEAERLPEPQNAEVAGLSLPQFDLRPLEPSAPAKMRHALMHLG